MKKNIYLYLFGLFLAGVAGGLAFYFGGFGGLVAVLIAQVGVMLVESSYGR